MTTETILAIGTVLGPILTLIATNLLSEREEKKSWQRERTAEEEDRGRVLRETQKTSLRELYLNAIHSLAMAKSETGQAHVETASRHLAELCIRHPSDELKFLYQRFTYKPEDYVGDLWHLVMSLAESEADAYYENRPGIVSKQKESATHRLEVQIDKPYRERRFIEGKILPRKAQLVISLEKDLDNSQRKLLLDGYRDTGVVFPPPVLHFYLPISKDGGKGIWQAQVDPDNIKAVFDAYRRDFEARLAADQNSNDGSP